MPRTPRDKNDKADMIEGSRKKGDRLDTVAVTIGRKAGDRRSALPHTECPKLKAYV
jgi:hypothetical protein